MLVLKLEESGARCIWRVGPNPTQLQGGMIGKGQNKVWGLFCNYGILGV